MFRVLPLLLLSLLAGPAAYAGSVSNAVLKQEFDTLHARAEKLGGKPGDIAQRAVFLREIFEASLRNDSFPMIALHGALWAHGFFPTRKELGKIAFLEHPFNRGRRGRELDALDRFSEEFKATNRQVFIDTYTNFYFTLVYGREPGARAFVKAELLSALNLVHAAVESGQPLSRAERRSVFEQSLLWEQEASVARKVDQAVREFGHPLLSFFALMPAVRFAYFPPGEEFRFKNFSDKQERIEYAMRAYELAEDSRSDSAASWDAVAGAMRDYGVLPDAYFADPAGYAWQLEQRILATARQHH